MKIPFVDDFEIETKAGVKCSEKAVRYIREESGEKKEKYKMIKKEIQSDN